MKTDQMSKTLFGLVVTIFCFILQPATVIAGALTFKKYPPKNIGLGQ